MESYRYVKWLVLIVVQVMDMPRLLKANSDLYKYYQTEEKGTVSWVVLANICIRFYSGMADGVSAKCVE